MGEQKLHQLRVLLMCYYIGPLDVTERVPWIRFCTSFLPSGSLLGIGPLDFSGTQLGVTSSYCVVLDRAGFSEKNIFTPEMVETGQK